MSKFYQLETDEWLKASKELKLSELRVLYYLRTLDPFGQHPVKFRVIDLAKNLECGKGTISKAIQRLSELGYINLEIVEAIATLTTKSKRFPTENQVSYRKQSTGNIGFPQETEFPTENIGFLQETSMSDRKPDSPQIGSGQASVFSKINSDQSRKDLRDRSDEIIFSENANSENSPIAIAIENEKVDDADKCDLKPIQETEDRISPVKHINPVEGDSPRRALEDFILKQMKFTPRDRTAYFAKFTTKDWQEWEIKFKPPANESNSPAFKAFVPEAIEVIPPDVALANIRRMREMLQRGGK